jgi:ATP-binding cassette subfamily F protein uup
VSHDRTFLDNVVTSMIAYEGDAHWREYEGGYEDYVVQKARSDIAIEATTAKAEVSKSAVTSKPSTNPSRSKLSNKEKMELEQIPGRIETMEQEQLRLSDQLANPELYKGDPQAIVHLKTQLAELEKQMQSSLTRWENLLAKEAS